MIQEKLFLEVQAYIDKNWTDPLLGRLSILQILGLSGTPTTGKKPKENCSLRK